MATTNTDLETKVKELAKECGLTDANVAGGNVGALGDGVLFQKFTDFFMKLLPIILPLILNKNETPTT